MFLVLGCDVELFEEYRWLQGPVLLAPVIELHKGVEEWEESGHWVWLSQDLDDADQPAKLKWSNERPT